MEKTRQPPVFCSWWQAVEINCHLRGPCTSAFCHAMNVEKGGRFFHQIHDALCSLSHHAAWQLRRRNHDLRIGELHTAAIHRELLPAAFEEAAQIASKTECLQCLHDGRSKSIAILVIEVIHRHNSPCAHQVLQALRQNRLRRAHNKREAHALLHSASSNGLPICEDFVIKYKILIREWHKSNRCNSFLSLGNGIRSVQDDINDVFFLRLTCSRRCNDNTDFKVPFFKDLVLFDCFQIRYLLSTHN
mmetsp:Transcript_27857/g.49393  ORF Transcript_27857/g.49393 Transcript_27857/m.49393 type:complete len:246 (+) Transcript_27857:393-1130(+)